MKSCALAAFLTVATLGRAQVAPSSPPTPVAPSAPPPIAAPANPAEVVSPQPVQTAASVLPLRIGGYELRELDIKKPFVLRIKDKVIETQLPIFVYYPVELASRTDAVKGLRQLYDSVVAIAAKPAATPADVKDILVQLDAALLKLESAPAADAKQSGSVVNAGVTAEAKDGNPGKEAGKPGVSG